MSVGLFMTAGQSGGAGAAVGAGAVVGLGFGVAAGSGVTGGRGVAIGIGQGGRLAPGDGAADAPGDGAAEGAGVAPVVAAGLDAGAVGAGVWATLGSAPKTSSRSAIAAIVPARTRMAARERFTRGPRTDVFLGSADRVVTSGMPRVAA